jgi:hypothetical protein
LETSNSVLVSFRREKSQSTFSARDEQFDPALLPVAKILVGGDLESELFCVEPQCRVLIPYWNTDDVDCT